MVKEANQPNADAREVSPSPPFWLVREWKERRELGGLKTTLQASKEDV